MLQRGRCVMCVSKCYLPMHMQSTITNALINMNWFRCVGVLSMKWTNSKEKSERANVRLLEGGVSVIYLPANISYFVSSKQWFSEFVIIHSVYWISHKRTNVGWPTSPNPPRLVIYRNLFRVVERHVINAIIDVSLTKLGECENRTKSKLTRSVATFAYDLILNCGRAHLLIGYISSLPGNWSNNVVCINIRVA